MQRNSIPHEQNVMVNAKSKYDYLKFAVFTKKRLSFTRKKYFITISIINYELAFISDACVLKEYNCETHT